MDIDSMYLAIAGSQIIGYKQGLKYIINDQEFYDLHYKEWLPWVGSSVADEKKLMGITTESQGEKIVCLVLKCYNLLIPTLNFVTYDFETVENIINKQDNVLVQLEPLSVVSAATVNDIITTLYFNLRNGSDFIEQWICQLFEVVIKVNEANQQNVPSATNEENHQHQREAEPHKPQVSDIGFNSKKNNISQTNNWITLEL
ncbi:MAG: hypothetical protein EZS28_040738 [Streblomastix strix]|uniref:Uncharacterized protein n=1 Tax=Streblomastix strix TaxID=222440 RepID=A0A5J4U278_9EUKA|nr:MAG: hypothetical protein EZS28_040738 [Streblomastix strix]